MAEHTKLPWRVFDMNGTIAIMAGKLERHNEVIHWAGFDASHFPADAPANAAYIVKACNAFPDLVKALEAIKQATLDGRVCDDVAWFGPGETLHDFCERILDRVKGAPDHG